MKVIEYLSDTKDKRMCLVILIGIICVLKEVISNILFSLPLLTIHSLESIYALVPYASKSFIGRLVYYLYMNTDYSFLTIIKKIAYCFRSNMIFIIVFCLYFLFARYKHRMISIAKRFSFSTLFLSISIYSVGLFLIAKQISLFTSYSIILNAVHMIALWVFVMHALLGVICLFFCFVVIREYLKALEYKAEEVPFDE